MIGPARSLAAALLAAVGVVAQQPLWEKVGVENTYSVGTRPVRVSDMNGDGIPDLLTPVGVTIAPYELLPEFWFRSGRDGSVLLKRTYPKELTYRFGMDYGAAGDLDMDGLIDWWWKRYPVISQPVPPVLEVRSTRDDRILFQCSGSGTGATANAILGGLDVDGDGKPDLVCVEDRLQPVSEIVVYRNNGTLLHRIQPPPYLGSWATGTTSIDRIGDLDADGCDDFGVTAFEPAARGAVVILSGKTGAILRVGYGEQPGDMMDGAVAGVGDVDGDGVPDFAGGSSGRFGAARGTVRIFSGNTAVPLHTFTVTWSTGGTGFGAVLVGGQDLDRDGIPDLLISDGTDVYSTGNEIWWGLLHAYSLRSFERIFMMRPGRSGWSPQALLPPVPGDRYPRFAVAEYQYGIRSGQTPPVLGRIAMYSARPWGVADHATGCTGLLVGRPEIGVGTYENTRCQVTVAGAPPDSFAFLFVGLPQTVWGSLTLPFDLGNLGMPNCPLQVRGDLIVPAQTGQAGNQSGCASVELPLKVGAFTWQNDLYLRTQWLVPGHHAVGGAVTDSLMLRTALR